MGGLKFNPLDLLVPGLGAATDLVGGLIGASAQESANETNLAIARERNELQEKLFNQQIGENWKMWNASNEYNSAVQQRERLQQAGYNPADLFSQNGASLASALPSPGAPNLATPQVQPVDAFGNAVSSAVGSGLSAMNALSESRKLDAEAAGVRIDNITRAARNKKELAILGDEESIKATEAALNEQTYNDRVNKAHSESLIADQTYHDLKEDTALKAAQRAVANSQLEINEQEKARLVEATSLLIQQQKTEVTEQDMYKALGSKYISEAHLAEVTAWYNEYIAPSVRESNYASAEASRAQAQFTMSQKEQQDLQNRLTKKYGESKALAELVQMASISKLNDMQAKKAAVEFVKLRREYKFMPLDRIADMLKGASGAAMLLMLL